MHENENGRADDGKAAENQSVTRRQRGCREQNRTEKKECKGILQSAGQEQKHRQFGDIECEQPSRSIGLEALRDVKTEPKCDVEPGRQGDHAKAGVDRQLELQTVIDNEHGGRLADNCKPAQPHERIETHVAVRVMLDISERRHAASVRSGLAL